LIRQIITSTLEYCKCNLITSRFNIEEIKTLRHKETKANVDNIQIHTETGSAS